MTLSELFEIKAITLPLYLPMSLLQCLTDDHFLNIAVNLNPVTYGTVIEHLLCALYHVRCFAYLTSLNSYAISAGTIKMKYREVK